MAYVFLGFYLYWNLFDELWGYWQKALIRPNILHYTKMNKIREISQWRLLQPYVQATSSSRQSLLPSPLLLTLRLIWMDKPVFDWKFFFICFTKTNKFKWESDIKSVGSQCLRGHPDSRPPLKNYYLSTVGIWIRDI